MSKLIKYLLKNTELLTFIFLICFSSYIVLQDSSLNILGVFFFIVIWLLSFFYFNYPVFILFLVSCGIAYLISRKIKSKIRLLYIYQLIGLIIYVFLAIVIFLTNIIYSPNIGPGESSPWVFILGILVVPFAAHFLEIITELISVAINKVKQSVKINL